MLLDWDLQFQAGKKSARELVIILTIVLIVQYMSKRILIIDDDKDIREATQICLETLSEWEILSAASGKEGLVTAAAENCPMLFF